MGGASVLLDAAGWAGAWVGARVLYWPRRLVLNGGPSPGGADGRCQCLIGCRWLGGAAGKNPCAGRCQCLIGRRLLDGAAWEDPCGQVPVFYSMHVSTVPQFDGIKQNEVRRDSPDDQLVPIPVALRPIDVSSSQDSCDWQTSERWLGGASVLLDAACWTVPRGKIPADRFQCSIRGSARCQSLPRP
jgi:hypothetical protein